MTISSETRRAGPFTGNDSTTSFPFEFKVFDESDLRVVFTDADGVDSDLVLDSDYSVTLNADQNTDPGGTITYPISGTELSTDETLTVVSDISYTQETDITNGGGFYPQIVENALDKLLAQIQQVKEMLDRAPMVSVSSSLADLVFPSPGASQYIRWNSAGTALEAVAAVSGAGTYTASGTGAVERAVDAGLDDRVNILNYYDGDGDFDTALQRAYNEAAARGRGTVYFPWRLAGYTINDYLEVTHAGVNLVGDNADIIYKWSAASQSAGLNGGTYNASPALLFRPTAGYNKVRGLRFSQYAGFPTTYSGSYTSAATFAAIIVQRADHVDVQDCYFDIDTGRAAYWRGGNYGKFGNNILIDSSVVAHIGEVSDTLFWDASTDLSTRYSPWLMSVFNNVIVGSNTTRLAPHSIFMTGVVCPQVVDNKLYGLNVDGAGGNDAIRVYANDLGLFNQNGTARTDHEMLVRNNHIYGTVAYAINVTCDSLLGSDTTSLGVVGANTANVTGGGIYVERGIGLGLSDNRIKSSSSPLVLADNCEGLRSSRNRYECTSAGESNRTLSIRSTAVLTDVWFRGDRIISPAGDIYCMDTSGVARGFEGGGLDDCTFVFGSTSTSSRILQLSESCGVVTVNACQFDIRATGITNRYLVSIDEAAGEVTTVHFTNNKAFSANATSYVSRGVSINNSDTCFISNNNVGNVHVICSGDVFVNDNTISNGVASVVALTVENAARVKAHHNHLAHSLTTNTRVAEFTACARTTFDHNTLSANTSTVLVLAATSGVLMLDQNDYDNAGSGEPAGVSGTAKIGGDLGSYFSTNGSGTLWTNANRLSAGDMRPGARFWNSSDNGINESNGSGWYQAGAST